MTQITPPRAVPSDGDPIAPRAVAPLRRSSKGMLGGVCAGVALRLGTSTKAVRAAAVLSIGLFGIGLLCYFAAWALLAREGEEHAPAARVLEDRRQLHIVLAVGTVVAAVLVVLQVLGVQQSAIVAWPVLLTAAFALCVWRGVSDDERAWLQERLDTAPLVRPATSTGWRAIALRACLGGALLAIGAVLASKVGSLRGAAIGVFVGTLCVCAGLLTLFAPWWLRTLRDLSSERHARLRAQERADVAAHLHDSVLQTLLLIQKAASSPTEVVRLARNQERELRNWLFNPSASVRSGASFASSARSIEQDVENDYDVAVELVVVGDCPLDEPTQALLAAGREAAVNAAKWSGSRRISIYAEVEPAAISLFVRDLGVGFDTASIPEDRRGIAYSIRDRMTRHGGDAIIRSTMGQGTEVELVLPRQVQPA